MKADTLIIVETTVPPGTCEKQILPILINCFDKRKISSKKINLSHSYERVMPGPDYLDSIINNWRVYSGYNNKSAKLCKIFLSSISIVIQARLIKRIIFADVFIIPPKKPKK